MYVATRGGRRYLELGGGGYTNDGACLRTHMLGGVWGHAPPPKKIVKLGALRSLLTHSEAMFVLKFIFGLKFTFGLDAARILGPSVGVVRKGSKRSPYQIV